MSLSLNFTFHDIPGLNVTFQGLWQKLSLYSAGYNFRYFRKLIYISPIINIRYLPFITGEGARRKYGGSTNNIDDLERGLDKNKHTIQ